MAGRKHLIIILNLIFAGCFGTSYGIEADAEKGAIEQTINDCIKWLLPEKEPDRILGSLAKDSAFFIFHPDSKSTIRGYDEFEDMIQTLFMKDELKVFQIDVSDLKINISLSGDVSWFSCLLNEHGEWNGHPYDRVNTRWTGVLEKRDGKWLIVQMHLSFASDAKSETDNQDTDGATESP